MSNEIAVQNIVEAVKLAGFTVTKKNEDGWSWIEILTTNGNSITVGRAHNKETHWNAYPNAFRNNKNELCRPSWCITPNATIAKTTTIEKLAKWLTKKEAEWSEWFAESKRIQTENNNYNNTLENNQKKIIATGIVTKSNHSEKLNIHANSDIGCFGTVEVYKNTCHLELSSLPIDKVIEILNLLK